ncbi:hypothetical protein ACS0TY_033351 [Phlomoides rotata]
MEKDAASLQLKKMIPQLLLSLSVFSFLYSYSSSLLYSSKFQYHFSADSLHFLSHALLDKNCLFLICNGLLVILSKSSGFIRAPSDPDPDDGLHNRISDSLHTALQKYVLEEVAVIHDSTKEEEKKREKSTESTGEEVSIFIAESEEELAGDDDEEEEKDENDHQLDSNRFWLFDDDDDELYGDEDHEEEEEEEEEMSTEELNQKIEDFIRRMKEEIIISEARHKKMVVVK